MTAILNLSTVAVMWFGAMRVDDGAMPIGSLTAFLQYLMQILFAVLTAVFMFIFIPRAAVSAGRISEVLETEPTIRDPVEPVRATDAGQRGVVEFRNVEFRYPGAEEPVLREHVVPRRARARRRRSSAAPAAARPRSSTSSRASTTRPADRSWSTASTSASRTARSCGGGSALVPQKAFLFSGTVASNLRFGDAEATDDELWQALEIAQARDFVEEMADGLDAPIDQGGTNVSGGQRQRLAIARALVRNADIVVFDDSFSALDFATDARLRAALAEELEDTTVIIVAQRVGTIMSADRIIVLDAGRIVGTGTHRELLESNETYQRDRLLAAIRGGGGGMSGRPGGGAPTPERGPGTRRRDRRRCAWRPSGWSSGRRSGPAGRRPARRDDDGHGHGPAAGQGQ